MFIKLFLRRRRELFNLVANNVCKRKLHNEVLPSAVNKNYEYLLVLDFEATCDEQKKKQSFQEIIEFPCIKLNIKTLKEEGRFHHYVRPVHNPILSHFCVELTGILQEMVDSANTFPEVYDMFEEWRKKEGLTEENSLYVTSGDWDLGHMMPEQCALSHKNLPSHMQIWADIKKVFGYNYDYFYNSFLEIMYHFNLEFEGRVHSGIDDCLNMVKVIKKMEESFVKIQPTTRLSNHKVEVIHSTLKNHMCKNIEKPRVMKPNIGNRRR